MPTTRYGRVRRLLQSRRAIIISYKPFTIQLTYNTPNIVQGVSLGVDTGSKHIGLSATTSKHALFEAQVELRTDISRKLALRKELRRSRRSRKTRYRPCRYLNRIARKRTGWIAPSIRYKIQAHVYWIHKICNILPITSICIETAPFHLAELYKDTQNTIPSDPQLIFRNTRAYVKYRDQFTCQCCHGRSYDKRLHVHHIESRLTGGNSHDNLVTVCKTCHVLLHEGKIKLPANIHSKVKFTQDASCMDIMRKTLLNAVRSTINPAITCTETFGYVTECIRDNNNLPKTHTIDARCISGNPLAHPSECIWNFTKIRRNNRQLHKVTFQKHHIRKCNQTAYEVYGYRLMDTVKYNGTLCYVKGRRSRGSFSINAFDHTEIANSISYKKLTLVRHNDGYLPCQTPSN
jgi:N6-L-threonylcarbamoyladenine synthase